MDPNMSSEEEKKVEALKGLESVPADMN